MKVCPTCRIEYAGGEVFCPVDASRLVLDSRAASGRRDPADPLIGTILAGRYEVIRRVGEGGMGLVYEGKHLGIEKRVAIKVLRDDLSRRPDVVERFRQEARSASRIGHQNIVDVSDFGETVRGASYFVMEFLEGEDLADLRARDATLETQRACHVVAQCCLALGATHAMHIVHRDIKPENIFLTRRGDKRDFVKIVDFGIAKMSDIETEGVPGRKLTKTGMIFGTPEYMSPEQAAGRELDHRVDIYALGVILYECLAGRVPFVGDSFMGILTQHLFQEPPRIKELNPGSKASAHLEAVVLKALAKNPRDRYQTMDAFAEALESAANEQIDDANGADHPVFVKREAKTTLVDALKAKRPRWPAVAVALGLVGVAGFGLWSATPGQPEAGGQSSQLSSPPIAVPIPVGRRATAGVDENPALVDVEVLTSPPGARVLLADGSEICPSAPCTIEAVAGEPLTLKARRENMTGRVRLKPTEDVPILIELSARSTKKRASTRDARKKRPVRAKSGASDLKVPEWAQ